MSRYQIMPPYAMSDDFIQVHFKPWVGCDYETGTNRGKRILLLGESHYTQKHINASYEQTIDHTRHIIQWGAVNGNEKFYAKVRNLVLRGSRQSVNGYESAKHRQQFWDKVAFYNYIQEFVGTKPKQRPKPHLWQAAESGLWEVLEKLKPDVCIVLGEELWSKLPKSDGTHGVNVVPFKDDETNIRFRRISITGHETLCVHTPHPSSIGQFKKERVVPIVERLFELVGINYGLIRIRKETHREDLHRLLREQGDTACP